MSIDNYINTLEKHIANADKSNVKVSAKTVGWQIDHSLKVIIGSSTAFLDSTPTEYKPKFNFTRFVLYTLNYIPRGKGKAPKAVTYDGEISKDYLLKNIEVARNNVAKVNVITDNHYFAHYLFGHLTKKKYIKFLNLHTKHHLKIIEDILG